METFMLVLVYTYKNSLSENHSGMETPFLNTSSFCSYPLSENHSGMETHRFQLSENHSGMETDILHLEILP
jgi:hypothetical protein